MVFTGSALMQLRAAGIADMGVSLQTLKPDPASAPVLRTVQNDDKMRRLDVELFGPVEGIFYADVPWLPALLTEHVVSEARQWFIPDWTGKLFAPDCDFRRSAALIPTAFSTPSLPADAAGLSRASCASLSRIEKCPG